MKGTHTMTRIDTIRKRRKELLNELSVLEQLRRGSLTDQSFRFTRKDGSVTQYGPYPLYTFKAKGRTVSRRIKDAAQVPIYRKQIDAFRRFEALSAELVRLGEEISELALSSEDELKKRPKRNSNVDSN
jgi:hypothetical protein